MDVIVVVVGAIDVKPEFGGPGAFELISISTGSLNCCALPISIELCCCWTILTVDGDPTAPPPLPIVAIFDGISTTGTLATSLDRDCGIAERLVPLLPPVAIFVLDDIVPAMVVLKPVGVLKCNWELVGTMGWDASRGNALASRTGPSVPVIWAVGVLEWE